MTPQDIWFVVVDSRRADVYRCCVSRSGGWRMAPGGRRDNAHVSEHQRGRPTELDGHTGTIHGGPHQGSLGHAREESEHRFAMELFGAGGWVWREVGANPDAAVHVFAPPRMVGVIRGVIPAHGRAGMTELHVGELVGTECEELVRHPRITEILGRTPAV